MNWLKNDRVSVSVSPIENITGHTGCALKRANHVFVVVDDGHSLDTVGHGHGESAGNVMVLATENGRRADLTSRIRALIQRAQCTEYAALTPGEKHCLLVLLEKEHQARERVRFGNRRQGLDSSNLKSGPAGPKGQTYGTITTW